MLAFGFALVLTVRDAQWIGVLGVLVSVLLTTAALTRARRRWGMFLGALAWPFSGLRGLPWLGRTLRSRGWGATPRPSRDGAPSLLGVLVFGLLFASADAIFGHWVERGGARHRGHPGAAHLPHGGRRRDGAGGGVPRAEPAARRAARRRRPAQHRFEWLAPVLLVDAVFVLFLAAQAAAFFGGHDYVQRTTGLTYAEYVHQGFAQLTIATALTLLVVGRPRARHGSTSPRTGWLRGSLGVLRAHPGRGRVGAAPDGPLPGRLRAHPAAAAGGRLRGLARAGRGGVVVAGVGLRGGWLRGSRCSRGGAPARARRAQPGRVDRAAQPRPLRGDREGRRSYLRSGSARRDAAGRAPPEEAACALGDVSPEKDAWVGLEPRAGRAIDGWRSSRFGRRAGCSEVVDRPRTYAGAWTTPRPAARTTLLPDGVVIADAEGVVTAVNAAGPPAARAGVEVGRPLPEVMALQDQESCDWYATNKPYDGLTSRVGLTEQAWFTPDGTEVLVTGRINRPPLRPGRERRAGDPVGPRPRPARPRPLRPGGDRGPRARSPLTGVKGFVGTLLSKWDRLNDEQKKLMLTTVYADSERLSRLITELLDVARIDTGGCRSTPGTWTPNRGREVRRVGPRGDHAARSSRRTPHRCRRSSPTPTSSPRWSPTSSTTRSATERARSR